MLKKQNFLHLCLIVLLITGIYLALESGSQFFGGMIILLSIVISTLVFQAEQLTQIRSNLIQAEKMASLGILGAGLAHELNQPLAAIRGYSQILLEEIPPLHPHWEDLTHINTQTKRMEKLIQNFLLFSRKSKGEKELVDLREIMENTLQLFRLTTQKSNITLIEDMDPNLPSLMANPGQLQQVFTNILINAMDALQENGGGKIWITGRSLRDAKKGTEVEITIKNNGPSIPKTVLPRLFDPFFTTKEPGRGTGLGLSISYSLVKNQGGKLTVHSEPGQGCSFSITLPLGPE